MDEDRFLEIKQILEEASITPPDNYPEARWFLTTQVVRRDGDRIISKEEVVMNEFIEVIARRTKLTVDELIDYHKLWKANRRSKSAGA